MNKIKQAEIAVRDAEKWTIDTAVTIHELDHEDELENCTYPICKALLELAKMIERRDKIKIQGCGE